MILIVVTIVQFKPLITTITGQLPPPNKLYVSTANFVSRRLTFTWSPVAPDCPALHYNILASNCGSCPTTTNHTNVTCTDVPTDNTVCTFAIQPVMCGSLVGNRSDPISITLQDGYIITGTCTNYLIANISLVVALITSVVVFTAAIVIILRRSKAKIKELQLSNGETSHAHVESMYEDPLPSASAINTRDNVAYGHTKAVTAVM